MKYLYLRCDTKFFIHPKARAKFLTNFDKHLYSSSQSIEVCLEMLSDSRKYFGTVVLKMLAVTTVINIVLLHSNARIIWRRKQKSHRGAA